MSLIRSPMPSHELLEDTKLFSKADPVFLVLGSWKVNGALTRLFCPFLSETHTRVLLQNKSRFGRCAAKKAGQFPGQKYSFILFFSFVVILFLQDKRPWFKRLSFVELSLSTRVSAASAAGLCCG